MEESAATSPSLYNNYAQPRRNRTLLRWSLLATVLALTYFTWQCTSGIRTGGQLSDNAVRHFHSQLDSEAYSDILGESDAAFQNSSSRDELMKFLKGVHSKLGPFLRFTRGNISVNASINGTLITVNYQSTFAKGSAVESFTWKKVRDGLKLVGYNVSSNLFLR